MKNQKLVIELNRPKMSKLQEFYFNKLDLIEKINYIKTKEGSKNFKYSNKLNLKKFIKHFNDLKSKEYNLIVDKMFQIDSWSPSNSAVLKKWRQFYMVHQIS